VKLILRGRGSILLKLQEEKRRHHDIIADIQSEIEDAELKKFQNSTFVFLFEKHKKVEIFEKIMKSLNPVD